MQCSALQRMVKRTRGEKAVPGAGPRCSHAAGGLPPAQGVPVLLCRAEPDVCRLCGEDLRPDACSTARAAAVHGELAPGPPGQPPPLLRGWESVGNQPRVYRPKKHTVSSQSSCEWEQSWARGSASSTSRAGLARLVLLLTQSCLLTLMGVWEGGNGGWLLCSKGWGSHFAISVPLEVWVPASACGAGVALFKKSQSWLLEASQS